MKLTIICPGIRTYNWFKLYESIKTSFSQEWEIIFVGPKGLPKELENLDNVKYIYDMGTPIRCQQIGLVNACGEWVTWAADDGIFLPNALDIGFDKLKQVAFNKKHVVMGKYREGDGNTEPMLSDHYYILSNHDATKSKWINPNFYMLNVGLVNLETLLDFGGWDCEFEVCPMAYNDLAIRLQMGGIKFIIQNEVMFTCSHMPGHMGDHGPIHDAQTLHDEPLFKRIYGTRDCQKRIKINLINYIDSPERWERRFGK